MNSSEKKLTAAGTIAATTGTALASGLIKEPFMTNKLSKPYQLKANTLSKLVKDKNLAGHLVNYASRIPAMTLGTGITFGVNDLLKPDDPENHGIIRNSILPGLAGGVASNLAIAPLVHKSFQATPEYQKLIDSKKLSNFRLMMSSRLGQAALSAPIAIATYNAVRGKDGDKASTSRKLLAGGAAAISGQAALTVPQILTEGLKDNIETSAKKFAGNLKNQKFWGKNFLGSKITRGLAAGRVVKGILPKVPGTLAATGASYFLYDYLKNKMKDKDILTKT